MLAASHSASAVQRYCNSSEKKKNFNLSTTPIKNQTKPAAEQKSQTKRIPPPKAKLLFFIDVKIKNEKSVKLSIYDNEKPEMTVQRFGLMNGLTLQQKKKLLENVKKFLSLETQNSQSINESVSKNYEDEDDDDIL